MSDRLPNRKKIRFENYDYSDFGVYYITVCTKDKQRIFWTNKTFSAYKVLGDAGISVGSDIIRPPDELFRSFTIVGQYVYKAVLEIHRHYPFIFVDTFTFMPNHIHLLLRIDNMIEAENSVVFSKTKSISTVIGQMKRTVSAQAGYSVWQKSFYDRIVRNDKEYSEIWQYINSNPFVWEKDY